MEWVDGIVWWDVTSCKLAFELRGEQAHFKTACSPRARTFLRPAIPSHTPHVQLTDCWL